MRQTALARQKLILQAALPLAEVKGYANLSREQIAEAAGIAAATVSYHWGTMTAFRKSLILYAIRVGCLKVIAQAIVSGESPLPEGDPLRVRALESLR